MTGALALRAHAHASPRRRNPLTRITRTESRSVMSKTSSFGRDRQPQPLRYIAADWKRWSRAERFGAIAITAVGVAAYGLSMAEMFTP
jgi:hypothetical protein